MGKKRRDKTTGLPIPSPVVPASSVCFSIQIPDAIEYRSAFKGALSALGDAWTWAQTEGSDNAASYQAAELWRARLQEAFYSLDCGGEDMSCADVANCIESDASVQEAIAQQIANNSAAPGPVYNTTIYGVPMTNSQASEPVIVSPGCGEDALFGSVTQVLDQLDTNNLDFLQVLEVATNTRERISAAIAAVPLLETLPIDDAIAFVDKLETEILENYEAQWTTALRDEYRCDLFCIALANEDCELSFDDLFGYWNDRLGAALEPVNFFTSVLQYFLLGTWSGSTVVDIMMLTQLGVWRQASTWSGVSLRTLQTVGLLGANSPDPDWEIIPCDCAPPPASDCEDLTTAQYGWNGRDGGGNINPTFGVYDAGTGMVPGVGNTWNVVRDPTPGLGASELRFTFGTALTNFYISSGGTYYGYTGAAATEIVFNEASHPGIWPWPLSVPLITTFPGNIAPSSAVLQEFCWEVDS